MRSLSTFFCIIIMSTFFSCNGKDEQKNVVLNDHQIVNQIIGTWVKTGPAGTNSFTFKDNGIVEGDFGKDGTIDITAAFRVSGDTIVFTDKTGVTCPDKGMYKLYQTKYYTSFDLISDTCSGRVKSIMGFWTRTNFEELLKEIDSTITVNQDLEAYLNRARVFLAIGDVSKAKKDFDVYLTENPTDSRALINRAGTRFPFDLKGVMDDCNKVIELDQTNKNAYFLRGLARYELGEKEEACADFEKAIELGFSVLRIAEEHRCAEFWNN